MKLLSSVTLLFACLLMAHFFSKEQNSPNRDKSSTVISNAVISNRPELLKKSELKFAPNIQLPINTALAKKVNLQAPIFASSDNKSDKKNKNPFDFSNSGLNEDEVADFLDGTTLPAGIEFYDEGRHESLLPTNQHQDIDEQGRKLSVSTLRFARKIAKERVDESFARVPGWIPAEDKKQDLFLQALLASEYKFFQFSPGKTNEGAMIVQNKNLRFSIKGPDYSFEQVNASDLAKLTEIRSRVVSLGHNGEITLALSDNGFIVDEAGPDFVVYENVFRLYDKPSILFNEFGAVGVSETPLEKDFVWFNCSPQNSNIKSCAGVVPTSEGGDAFDLGELKLKKIRFIKIRDTGLNFNKYNKSGENTEGFDLDAIGVLHGYKYENAK